MWFFLKFFYLLGFEGEFYCVVEDVWKNVFGLFVVCYSVFSMWIVNVVMVLLLFDCVDGCVYLILVNLVSCFYCLFEVEEI